MTIKGLRSVWRCSQNIINNSMYRATSTNAQHKSSDGNQSTVDKDDVQLFSQMKDWWDLNGPMKPLHSMNLIRVPFVRDGLVPPTIANRNPLPLQDKKILDVGCGGGILSEGLARLGANVTGIDASKELIDLATEHRDIDPKIANFKPTYCHTTIEEHASSHCNHYDGIVASEVIEHVNNKELFVKSCIQTLKPGGRIFFTTPNRTRVSQIGAVFLAEYVLKITPVGTHQYDKFITPNELTFLLERNDCHVEAVYGLFYHFLTNRWEFVNTQLLMFALQAVKLK